MVSRIFIIFLRKEVRKGMNEAALQKDIIIYIPSNYEGEECYSNVAYFGIPYQSNVYFIY